MSSEITSRKFHFPRKSLGIFRRNSEETIFRGNSEDYQFVGNLLGIYREKTSSEFTSEVPRNVRGNEPSENSNEQESLGIFRGTCPLVNSEGSFPRKIPRN
ncbi:hypothetical protein F2Q69_00059834 [Brassica cretica]|uniref:Uncharacterized protein n=1 Tax=Brassica cretica TaxID=69181 RepID=A0A8S9RF95_BRACR|nr:hypothetical protein F2Q69_00059834 [Brassica cretica]